MSWYQLFLFLHVCAAVLWVGGGMMIQIVGSRAAATNDDRAIIRVIDDTVWLATRFFIPSSVAALLFGIATAIAGGWSFGQLWIILGLLGFLATFLTGMLMIKPRSERIMAMIAREGASDAVKRESADLLTVSRIDYVVLFLVIADMTIKPTFSNWIVLLLMVVIGGGLIYYFANKGGLLGGARPRTA